VISFCKAVDKFENPADADSLYFLNYFDLPSATPAEKSRGTVIGDVINHLVKNIGIPEFTIQYLAQCRKLYYDITREKWIKSTVADYGQSVDGEKLEDRKTFFIEKYGVSETLDTFERTFRTGKCFCCKATLHPNVTPDSLTPEQHEELLRNHFESDHGVVFQPSDRAVQLSGKYEALRKSVENEAVCRAVEEHQETFRPKKLTGRQSLQQNSAPIPVKNSFYCKLCKFSFSTTLSAMCAHTKAHDDGDFQKIGIIVSKGSTKGKFRPEQHTLKANGSYTIGGDTKGVSHGKGS